MKAQSLLIAVLAAAAACVPAPNFELTGESLPQNSAGNFVLSVSNQDQGISPVDVTIYIDGNLAVADSFSHDGGHTHARYVFKLHRGRHSLLVVSKRGRAQKRAVFTIADKHWASVGFWGPAKGAVGGFSFRFTDKPIYFL